jgi:SAM-dependent methyltransferase
MDWVRGFYSRTGHWWAGAEAIMPDRDDRRVRLVHLHAGAEPKQVLELGSGHGATAAALARAGHQVTAVEITDRADFAARFAEDAADSSLTYLKEDFYDVQLSQHFDVVCYWNGFGVGSDADQRRLLRRISQEWLAPDGMALVDILNPFVWASWDDEPEHHPALPDLGYPHDLYQQIRFDPITCTATDTWWPTSDPEDRISQHLRCYTPADLMLLLEGTGLELSAITVGEQTHPLEPQPGMPELLRDHYEYVAVLRHA